MTLYRVNTIYRTIQGEGTNTGIPMVILRLQGCSVGCVWCDQKETWKEDYTNHEATLRDVNKTPMAWVWAEETAIRNYIRQHCAGYKWVLLTGGEPAEQNLKDLVDCLHSAGYMVALETSGTADGHLQTNCDWVCVSPKMNMPGNKPLIREVMESADELKFIVCRTDDLNIIAKCVGDYWKDKSPNRVCLQPVSQSPAATVLAIEWCQLNNWRLSVQTHKYLNIP